MDSFRALRVHEAQGAQGVVSARLEQLTLADLTAGDVVIRGDWSSINYKDALAVTGKGRILRKYPLVAGIDVAGQVISSTSAGFKPGDVVVASSGGLSEVYDGGYSEICRLPAEKLARLPPTLDARTAMMFGTAGFTAALAIRRLEENGQRPDRGPIAVTGATGGVGSFAIAMLAGLGYQVTALTAKDDADDYLRSIGASDVLHLRGYELGSRPLEKMLWGGAIDNLGGDVLGWLTRTTRQYGNVAAVGLAKAAEFPATVMPFILRGVSLLGINCVEVSPAVRADLWRRIAGDLKPPTLSKIAMREVDLDHLLPCFEGYVAGTIRGRCVVRLR